MAIMAMACMRALVISIIFLASIRLPMARAAVSEEAPSDSYQFELIHVDASGNFSREELIRRALNRSRLRAAMLSAAAEDEDVDDTKSRAETFSVLAQNSPKNYLMELKMGVPETTFLAVADSGSDLIWTNQLRECIGNPSFTPTTASCSEACLREEKQCNTCIFDKTYGGGKITGFTGTETVSLTYGDGTRKEKQVDLVCAIGWTQNMLPEAGQGIVGLSQGPKSLVTQLGVTQFSYCLRDPLDPTQRSPLWFGPKAQSDAGGDNGWMTTPLVEISTKLSRQPEWAKNDYYVALDQICITDDKCCSGPLKPEDFRLRSSDGGMMLVDSGCTYTQLDPKIFDALKSVLHRALKSVLPRELDVTFVIKDDKNCFEYTKKEQDRSGEPEVQKPKFQKPDLVLKFPGADMRVPWASYVEEGEKGFCLYILDEGPSILGNFQQHNVPMLYDLDKKKLSFKGRVQECSSTN